MSQLSERTVEICQFLYYNKKGLFDFIWQKGHRMERYITQHRALKKLNACRSFKNVVYIFGATGFGKTELIRQYFMNKPYFYASCAERAWDYADVTNAAKGKKEPTVVVIDDLHLLFNEEKRREVIEFTRRGDIWLILISRSDIPEWLREAYVNSNFAIISEKDLGLSRDDVSEYLGHNGVSISQSDLALIVEKSEGNGFLVKFALVELLNGASVSRELFNRLRSNFIDMLHEKVLIWLEPEVNELLMKLSLVDSFDIELARVLSGISNIGGVIRRAEESGNFLHKDGESYTIRPTMREALYNELRRSCSQEQINGFIRNIALYYEMSGSESKAIEFYASCHDADKIRDLLVRNAKVNSDNGFFYEMRRYYLALSDSEIESESCLIAAMSLLYSAVLNIERSEYWYGRLKERLKTAGGLEKRKIIVETAYLDLALPHRGSGDILEMIESQYILMREKGATFPELSVTNCIPSLINGGKDFCDWTKRDREIAEEYGKTLSAFLGSYGKGLLNLGLAESLYEKGGDSYEISTLISKARNQIETGEFNCVMMFAAYGLMARLYLINGESAEARELIGSFCERISKTKYYFKLQKNIDALLCRISLYSGDFDAVNDWVQNRAPDENDFFVLFRYQYLTKIRCYIALERYAPAIALIDRLSDYAELYGRNYISMELAVLRAIIIYRNNGAWRDDFAAALRKIAGYGFVRIVSEHGAAVYPLLDAVRGEFLADGGLAGWFEKTLNETRKISLRYPVYLKTKIADLPALSENAVKILGMQAEGLTLKQIGERLGITERTAKFHAQETYRKLGVSGRTEAILAAKNLNII